jgi:hypothetical protein
MVEIFYVNIKAFRSYDQFNTSLVKEGFMLTLVFSGVRVARSLVKEEF